MQSLEIQYFAILKEMASIGVPWNYCELALFSLAADTPRQEIIQRIEDYAREHPAPPVFRYPNPGWLGHLFKRLPSQPNKVSSIFSMICDITFQLEVRNNNLNEATQILKEASDFLEEYSQASLDPPLTQSEIEHYRDLVNLSLEGNYERSDLQDLAQACRAKVREGKTLETLAFEQSVEILTQATHSTARGAQQDTGLVYTTPDYAENLPPRYPLDSAFGCWWKGREYKIAQDFAQADEWFSKAIDKLETEIHIPIDDDSPFYKFNETLIEYDDMARYYLTRNLFKDAARWLAIEEIKTGCVEHQELTEFIQHERHKRWAAIKTGMGELEVAEKHFLGALEHVEDSNKMRAERLMDYAVFLEKTGREKDADNYLRQLRKVDDSANLLWNSIYLTFILKTDIIETLCAAPLFENINHCAARWLDEVQAILDEGNQRVSPAEQIFFLRTCAQIYSLAGRHKEARRYLDQAITLTDGDLSKVTAYINELIRELEELILLFEKEGTELEIEGLRNKLDLARTLA